MLAEAAKKADLDALVIDIYADQDTQNYAVAVTQAASLARADIAGAVDELIVQYGVKHVIYGSGFEYYPDTLHYLATRLQIIGNSPDIFKRVLDKPTFFKLLDKLAIPYPSVSFVVPGHADDWIIKPLQGQGGIGIQVYNPLAVVPDDVYWQQQQKGTAHSVLFLAAGTQVQVVGFNTQWTQCLSDDQAFMFAGIINTCALGMQQKKTVSGWLVQLVADLQLKGLNSLDFISNGEQLWVLEINARPSASMQLYSADLLTRHIQACQGNLVAITEQQTVTGLQIVYAQRTLHISEYFLWPSGCKDIPDAGTRCQIAQPVCTVMAQHEQAQQVYAELLLNQLNLNCRFTCMEHFASVNKLTQPLVKQLLDNADKLRLGVSTLDNGSTVIDAGINVPGGLEAGRIIAEICLGGMGTVSISHSTYTENWPLTVNVYTSNPVLGCLGSQYAGWSLSHEKYYALGSGPARALATKLKEGKQEPVEELYKELAYQDKADTAVLVIENDALPPLTLVEKIAAACAVAPDKLTIIVTPTSSLAGGVQVVARVLEVAMHKAHALHFPLENIIDGSGSAPICPPHPKFVKAMGRTNDAILFAGQVHLFVKGSDEAAEKLANELPSSTSKDYGKPFADIFKQYEYDFFKIDAMLFSPASVIVTAVDSGKSFRAGRLDNELLDLSFGS